MSLIVLYLVLISRRCCRRRRQSCHRHCHLVGVVILILIVLTSSWPRCIIYIYIYFCRSNLCPNNGITLPPRAPYLSHLPSILSYVADTYFWLVVVRKLIWLRPFKAMVYFFFIFFVAQFWSHHNNGIIFPTRLPLVAPHLHASLCCGRLFLVGCCVSRCQSRAIHRQRCISYIYFFIV